MNSRFFWLTATMFAIVGATANARAQFDEPVRIALRDNVVSNRTVVSIGELVETSGGNSSHRAKIAKLKLEIDREGNSTPTVSRSEILARILLAGFATDEFELTGPDEIQLRSANPIAVDLEISKAIQRHLSKSFNIDEQSIDVSLQLDQEQIDAFSRLTSEQHIIRPLENANQMIGRRMIELGVFSGNQLISSVRILATTSIRKQILVTSRPIRAGEKLDQSNSYVEEREIYRTNQTTTLPAEVLGQFAKRNLRAQQPVNLADVRRESEVLQVNETVIKSRDIVNVVASKNGLKITLAGAEALRGGRVGDVIPLRNPNSKEKIFGRIKSKDLVELIY